MEATATTPPPISAAKRNLVLAVMCLALVMVVAAVTMLANGLPLLAGSLDASQAQQQWIVDAYTLALAALLLPAGALGDRYGRRGALIIGLIIFGVSSALSATADTASVLIGWRVVTGIGAALVMPGTLSTITSVFPPEERAKAVGIWAGFAGIGGTLGLLFAGALLESYSWESIFVVTAVLAAAALLGVIFVVPATKSSEHVRLDPPGSVLSSIGIALLILGIIEGPERGWSDPITLGALVGGVALIALFLRVELRRDDPMLDPRLFRRRGFATGSASLFLQFFAMFGFFFVALQYLQLVLGYSALTAAVALLPMSIFLLPLSV
ncbi:MAG TPA: MFS transporter, partial [Solirubrobacterales bacterium]|nr:MFS transporter [Solirubrobacterales bacterium]